MNSSVEVNKTDDEKIDENHIRKNRILSFEIDIPVSEFLVYVFVWTVSIFYSLYVLHNELLNFTSNIAHDDNLLKTGFFGLNQDVSDIEWQAMLIVYKSSFYWYVLSAVIPKIFRYKLKRYASVLLSVFYLIWFFRLPTFCFFIVPIYSIYIVHLLRRKYLCIGSGVALIVFYTSGFGLSVVDYLAVTDVEYLLIQGAICWVTCRSISFCVDRIDKTCESISDDLIEAMAYCFYFPALLRGPFLSYDKFVVQLTDQRKLALLKPFYLICRYATWFLVLVAFYHLFHVNALVMFPDEASKLSAWAIGGLVFSTGTIFMLKYTVIYGHAQILASIDSVELPPPPRCIACLPLYSYFWRYFDPGMYMFIRLYLYLPLFQLKQSFLLKIIGSLLCFTFVYFWHGTRWSIFVWTSLNFCGILLEMFGRRVAKSKFFKARSCSISKSTLSRFKAVCVTPLYILSVLSTAFFLTGFDIGMTCLDKMFVSGFPLTTGTLFLIFYCASHVGLVVLNWLNSKSSSFKC